MIDAGHFEELSRMSPEDVCRRALCRYDSDSGCFLVEAWGDICEIDPEKAEIKWIEKETPPGLGFELAVLFYLLRSEERPIAGEWISEKDIPDGVAFFRGPHAIPSNLIAEKYGRDPDGFRKKCESLDGEPLEMGDAAFYFRVLPRLPVAVLLWKADDEFEAEARILFDRTISYLPPDVIFGLCLEICARISGGKE